MDAHQAFATVAVGLNRCKAYFPEDKVLGIWMWLGAEHYFLGYFSFHDYLLFIGLYASLYIVDEKTYKTF